MQPFNQYFETEEEKNARLRELGFDPAKYDYIYPNTPTVAPPVANKTPGTFDALATGARRSIGSTAAGLGASAALMPAATAAAPFTYGLSYLAPLVAGFVGAYGGG